MAARDGSESGEIRMIEREKERKRQSETVLNKVAECWQPQTRYGQAPFKLFLALLLKKWAIGHKSRHGGAQTR
jgi:hypothetical protein